MKKCITVLAGLMVACTTVIHAEDLQFPRRTNGISAVTAPLVSQKNYWTNGVVLWTSADRFLTDETSIAMPTAAFAAASGLASVTDAGMENGFVQAADSYASPLGLFSGNEILEWMTGGTNTPGRSGGGNKNNYQTIIIESTPSPPAVFTTESRSSEYRFDSNHPQPAWYDWFNPRLFLAKWVDYWMYETNATPVVLLLVRF